MGAYSKMDLDLQYGDAPFSEEGSPLSLMEENTPSATEIGESQRTQDTVLPDAPSTMAQAGGTVQAEEQSCSAKEAADKKEAEDKKRKAHEESEARRKAEFDARQAAKKAEERKKLDELAAMSDDEVMAASMKRVSTDTEKLTRRNMKECVAEHIQTMCIEDPAFARKTMHPRKSMIRCFQYISRKAWEYVQDELKANGIQPGPGQQGYGADVPDDLCYQWAVDYFNNPDIKEDHEDEETFVPKPYAGSSTAKNKGSKTTKGKSGDKKADTPQKSAAKGTPKQTPASTGQITLGDFMMPEEKAG